jgi:hypothetical protein
MKQSTLFWILAVIITLALMVYQRITGPTYPVSDSAQLGGKTIAYKFDRSHPGPTDATVAVKTNDQSVTGVLFWKRFKTDDDWTQVPMSYEEGVLKATLPNQPAAGKLTYRVELHQGDQHASLPADEAIVIRFRGETPLWIVIPHVIAMFGAFLFSARAGMEFFTKEPKLKRLTYLTLGFLVVGGFVLGPLMQYYAFNAWWTGWPFGTDLTDNKTAIAFIAWVVSALMLHRGKNPKAWALGAAIVTIVVYLIPHSVLGSELDYSKMEKQNIKTEVPRQ